MGATDEYFRFKEQNLVDLINTSEGAGKTTRQHIKHFTEKVLTD